MSLKTYFDRSTREIKKTKKTVKKINEFEAGMQQLSDEELKQKTTEFKNRISKGEHLEDILPEAFAVVREAAKRVLGMRHYDVQLVGGTVLHKGNIAEMKTGEGKTLVATLPVYLNALSGKGVHVVTVNEYLAKRDAEIMGQLYGFLGLTVGLNVNRLSHAEKQQAYACDITYSTNNELGFDYLRDNMVMDLSEKVQRGLHYAVIDEVDSVLIDEARTPLIISGSGEESTELYVVANLFVQTLKPEMDYIIDVKSKSVQLTEEGVGKGEKAFKVANLYDLENVRILHHLNQALRAHVIMKRDTDYVVHENEIVIVDQFTGRLMPGRRYSDGLHQAIEAKEKVEVQEESKTLASITFQNYFRMYKKLSGMTGTAKTEEEEFKSIYGMDVILVPTNKPVIRVDAADVVLKNQKGKFQKVVEEIMERNRMGQPVLVGTANIETSEYLSDLLAERHIAHHVLNAKNHEKEADIIAQAGQLHAVTIATNMAGRGTDIVLGEGVKDLGGLCVIGTERHESRRIDNQLRGRAGRQGDPGFSKFYISMEDDLMRRFGADNMMAMMERLGIEENEPIESRLITRAVESAQKRVEGNNFDVRKTILQYDDVMRQQREVMYAQRQKVLETEHLLPTIESMFQSVLERKLTQFSADETEEADYESLAAHLEQTIMPHIPISQEELKGKEVEDMAQYLFTCFQAGYARKAKEIGEEVFASYQRSLLLQTVDRFWMEHIDTMDQLREGIHLRAYGQIDPLREYQTEGFYLFQQMIEMIEEEVSTYLLRIELQENYPFGELLPVEPVFFFEEEGLIASEAEGEQNNPLENKTKEDK